MHAVLIVDDESLVREAIARLADWSLFEVSRVVEVADALQALQLLQSDPELDIVLTDMKMPEMDGVQFLQEMETLGLRRAVIAISGYSDYLYTRQAIQSGLVDYILKPVVPEDLNTALSAAVALLERNMVEDEPVLVSQDNPVIEEVLAFLSQHFLEKVSLQDLADQFAVSREHLSRQFKKHVGVNLFEYIARMKIEAAKVRIIQSSQPIKIIAYELGFQDEHYFSKAFRRVVNQSPTEFRLNAWRNGKLVPPANS